jgi:hypothetical protein
LTVICLTDSVARTFLRQQLTGAKLADSKWQLKRAIGRGRTQAGALARVVIVIASLLSGAPVFAAEVYQCTKAGSVVFQDHPCDSGTTSELREYSSPSPAQQHWRGPTPIPRPVITLPPTPAWLLAHQRANLPPVAAKRSEIISNPAPVAIAGDTLVASHTQPPTGFPQPPIPREQVNGAKIVMVSGYESIRADCTNGCKLPKPGTAAAQNGTSQQPVEVTLFYPGQKVLLLLDSNAQVPWNIKVGANTQLVGILQGYSPSNGKPAPVSAPLKAVPVSMTYVDEPGTARFAGALQMLSWWYGVQKIDAFYGNYRLPASVVMDQLSDDPKLAMGMRVSRLTEAEASALSFKLPLASGGYESWTAAGPANGRASGYALDNLVVDNPEGDMTYAMSRGEQGYVLAIDKKTGHKTQFAATANLPNFAFPSAMALDTRHHILSLITLVGEGFIYRYDLKQQRWIDYHSMKDIDVTSCAYDQVHDRYIAISGYGALLFISSDGKIQASMPLLKQLAGVDRLYDKDGRSALAMPMIIPRENGAVLVGYAGDSVKLVWYLDYTKNQTRLTYSSY